MFFLAVPAFRKSLMVLAGAAVVGACNSDGSDDPAADLTQSLQSKVQTIVVIYAENMSFDKLYGTFPGANGTPGINPASTGTVVPQKDRTAGSPVLTMLPQTWERRQRPASSRRHPGTKREPSQQAVLDRVSLRHAVVADDHYARPVSPFLRGADANRRRNQ